MRVKVECYIGGRGEQMPRRFNLDGWSVEVLETLDQWQGADFFYFKLMGAGRKSLHPAQPVQASIHNHFSGDRHPTCRRNFMQSRPAASTEWRRFAT